jgi:molecular chaperone HscB
MAGCWSCDAPVGAEAAFCGCGAIQPLQPGLDHFAVMGLLRRFDLDPGELAQRHKELSRRLHPDRFARADPRARRYSLERATQLNDAYKVLREPARRAEYLLRLHGMDVTDEKKTVGDPELLMQVMEDREALAEARAAGDRAGLAALGERVVGQRQAALQQVGEAFGRGALEEAARQVVALRYLDRFLEELDG